MNGVQVIKELTLIFTAGKGMEKENEIFFEALDRGFKNGDFRLVKLSLNGFDYLFKGTHAYSTFKQMEALILAECEIMGYLTKIGGNA
jgi:hypothetical protein